jgi:poly(A) polymerase
MLHRVPEVYKTVLNRLVDAGHEAYFVGGAVRDLLLNLEPKDYDVATSATPEQVAKVFENVELVGAHFGVSLVKLEGCTVEVATFRVDGNYSDGRRPDAVTVTRDIKEDVRRRDFTMNALLMTNTGRVVDYVGGLLDLAKGLVRAVGDPDERFKEDPVRMLRAVKFAAKRRMRLGVRLSEAATRNRKLLERVAPERVAKELSDILTSGNADYGFRLLHDLGLSEVVLPEFDRLKDTPQNPLHHPEGDVMVHTLGVMSRLDKDCSLTLALAALLHDFGKPDTLAFDSNGYPTAHGHDEVGAKIAERVLRRLKFPNEVVDKVATLVDQHMRFRVLPEMKKAKQLRFVRQPHFEELLKLHHMDALAGSGKLGSYFFAVKLLDLTPPEVLRPERLVTGDDLLKMGAKPGPLFREVLEAVENQQLEGNFTTREEALGYARSYLSAFEERSA